MPSSAPCRPSEELEPVLTALSNEILELPSDFVLVLDDYHVLRLRGGPRRPRFLAGPLRRHRCTCRRRAREPSRCRSRGCAPRGGSPSLARPDLRFTLEEASDFLGRTMGLDLSARASRRWKKGRRVGSPASSWRRTP